MQVTVEAYLGYTGSIISQYTNYVNHVNKKNISTLWFIYLVEKNNDNRNNVCANNLTSTPTFWVTFSPHYSLFPTIFGPSALVKLFRMLLTYF